MLINVLEPEETRVAILEEDRLEELYLERTTKERIVGNIYKGVVTNIEPSIEAAFIDFGYRKHGFLHVSDLRADVAKGKSGGGRKKISQMLQEGQHLLVQVTKEGIGDKGPALSTYLSLPGRCLVLMPDIKRLGVSRKIQDQGERKRLRNIIKDVDVPSNMGIIARTASEGKSKTDLQRDLQYLLRLWKVVDSRAKKSSAPALVYHESDQVIRVMRDVFNEDIRSIVVDSQEVYDKVKEFMRAVMPKHVRKVKLYEGEVPLFHEYNVDKEIEKMESRTVTLKSGGSIVLEQTEALVAIDVNSGQYKGKASAEETAYRTNLEAAPEIARQVRLRDLGGVVAIDFIDMEDANHRSEVEKALWNALKRDRARLRMLKMSPFCIVEMTRQRRRRSWRQATYVECPACHGRAFVKSPQTLGLQLLRKIRVELNQRNDIKRVQVAVAPGVANYINNEMRSRLEDLADHSGKEIEVDADPTLGVEEHKVRLMKESGKQIAV